MGDGLAARGGYRGCFFWSVGSGGFRTVDEDVQGILGSAIRLWVIVGFALDGTDGVFNRGSI